MKSKILLISLVIIAIISAFCINYANTENEVIAAFEPTIETIDGKECFFANGTPITIVERGDGQEGATIQYWLGTEQKYANVSKDVSIFGGSHNLEGKLQYTNIYMNGGTVKNIFGGGLHKCYVENAYIEIRNGTITSICTGGAGSFVKDTDQPNYLANNTIKENMVNKTDKTQMFIYDGVIKSTVFGGGEGISYVGRSGIAIYGGDLTKAYFTVAGANGITETATATLYDGKLNIVQGINRGTVNVSAFSVDGGEIDTLYVGGETSDSNVTAKANSLQSTLTAGKIKKIEMGKNDGEEIKSFDPNMILMYTPDVDIEEFGGKAEELFKKYVMISWKENLTHYLPFNGKLSDISDLEEHNKKGFKGYYKKGTDIKIELDEPLTENMDIEAKFVPYYNVEIIYEGQFDLWVEQGKALKDTIDLPKFEENGKILVGYYCKEQERYIELDEIITKDIVLEPVIIDVKEETEENIKIDASENNEGFITVEVLEIIKESDKKVDITDGIITWTIEPEKIEDTSLKIKSTKVTLTEKAPERVEKVEELVKDLENVKYLNFEHHGKLPGKIKVTVDVSNEYKDGQKLIVKHYNETENKLENEIEVEVKDGKITFEVETLSTYVLSEKIAKVEDTTKDEVKEEPKVEDIEKEETKEEPKVEDTTKEETKEEPKVEDITKEEETSKAENEKEDKNGNTPKTGDPIFIAFGILALAISIRIVYAIRNKKSKK